MLMKKYKQLKVNAAKVNAPDSQRSGTKSKGRKSMLSGQDKEISLAGGRFTFAYELWVDRSTLGLECVENVDPLNPRRYEEASLQKIAVVAEIHASLSPSLRACLTDKDRRETFIETVCQYFVSSKYSNRSQRHTSSFPNTTKSGLT
jgi:hypothetical protein